jgi:hypothetical protein
LGMAAFGDWDHVYGATARNVWEDGKGATTASESNLRRRGWRGGQGSVRARDRVHGHVTYHFPFRPSSSTLPASCLSGPPSSGFIYYHFITTYMLYQCTLYISRFCVRPLRLEKARLDHYCSMSSQYLSTSLRVSGSSGGWERQSAHPPKTWSRQDAWVEAARGLPASERRLVGGRRGSPEPPIGRANELKVLVGERGRDGKG